MNATISFDRSHLWQIIQALSLSTNNKLWLGEKLIEEARQEEKCQEQSYADFIHSMCGAWNDDPRPAEEISEDIRRARHFGVTRQIMPLDDEDC